MSAVRTLFAWLASHLARRRTARLAGVVMLLLVLGTVAWIGLSGRSELNVYVAAFGGIGLLAIAGFYFALRTLGFAHRVSVEIADLKNALSAANQRTILLDEETRIRAARMDAEFERMTDSLRNSSAAAVAELKTELVAAETGDFNDLRARQDELRIRLQDLASWHERVGAGARAAIDSLTRDLGGLQAQHSADFAQLRSSLDSMAQVLTDVHLLRAAQAESSNSINAQSRRVEAVERTNTELRDRVEGFTEITGRIEARLHEQSSSQDSDRTELARLQRELVALSGLSVAVHDRLESLSGRSSEAWAAIEDLTSKHGHLAGGLRDIEAGLAAMNDEGSTRSEQLVMRLGSIEERANESTRTFADIYGKQAALEGNLGELALGIKELSERLAARTAQFDDVQMRLDRVVAESKDNFERVQAQIGILEDRQTTFGVQDEQLSTSLSALSQEVAIGFAQSRQESDRAATSIAEIRDSLERVERNHQEVGKQVGQLLIHQTEAAAAIERLEISRSDLDSRLSNAAGSIRSAEDRLAQLDTSTDALREQSARLATDIGTLLTNNAEVATKVDSLTSWRSEVDSGFTEATSSIRSAEDRLAQLDKSTDALREQSARLATDIGTLLTNNAEVATKVDSLTSWRSEVDSRLGDTEGSIRSAEDEFAQLNTANDALREQASHLATNVAALINDNAEMASKVDGLASWRSEVDGKISETNSSVGMAADNIREVQSAIVAVRAQASALGAEISKQLLTLESALTHSVRDLEENHGLKLRDISTKHEQWSAQYERKLVDLAAQVKALEKLAHEAPHAEELRVISQDLSDLAQLVNESELGMAGDIAKLSGETLDHADLLASIGSAVRSLEARVKDVSSVSTEFSGIVTRVDSKANMLSQVQADILQRIQAIEARAVAERSPSANSLDHDAPPRPKQSRQSRQSKSGKVAGKKRGIPPAGAKTTPRASAQTKARTRR